MATKSYICVLSAGSCALRRVTPHPSPLSCRARGATVSHSYWLEMYKQKNSSGVNVSIMALGGWHIGPGSVKDQAEAIRIMHTARRLDRREDPKDDECG